MSNLSVNLINYRMLKFLFLFSVMTCHTMSYIDLQKVMQFLVNFAFAFREQFLSVVVLVIFLNITFFYYYSSRIDAGLIYHTFQKFTDIFISIISNSNRIAFSSLMIIDMKLIPFVVITAYVVTLLSCRQITDVDVPDHHCADGLQRCSLVLFFLSLSTAFLLLSPFHKEKPINYTGIEQYCNTAKV